VTTIYCSTKSEATRCSGS